MFDARRSITSATMRPSASRRMYRTRGARELGHGQRRDRLAVDVARAQRVSDGSATEAAPAESPVTEPALLSGASDDVVLEERRSAGE